MATMTPTHGGDGPHTQPDCRGTPPASAVAFTASGGIGAQPLRAGRLPARFLQAANDSVGSGDVPPSRPTAERA